MKTVMQEFIEMLEVAKGIPLPEGLKVLWLLKERQQIEEAYHDGVYDGWCIDNNAGIRLHDSPHDYFTKKINDENSNAGIKMSYKRQNKKS